MRVSLKSKRFRTVQRLATFDLDNTLVNLNEAFQVWVSEFVEERDLGNEAVGWLIALNRAGYPHREGFFSKSGH
jgi:FMN phosphatase YigB (HAD superfamily)